MIRVSFCLAILAGTASAVSLPVFFEPNRGQAPAGVEYLSGGSGPPAHLNTDGAVLFTGESKVHMRLVGARQARGEGLERLPGESAYLGNPARTLTHIPQFGRVRYANVYPGVDLVYYGNNGGLEYDFVLKPGSDPSLIRLAYDGAEARIVASGDLMLTAGSGRIRQRKPTVYQERDGHRTVIDARYRLTGAGTVGIEVARFDNTRPLVIDPTLEYLSYVADKAGVPAPITRMKLDSSGNVYMGSYRGVNSNQMWSTPTYTSYLVKYSPTAKQVIYSVYLEPFTGAQLAAFDVDSSGSAYVVFGADNFAGRAIMKIGADGQSVIYSKTLKGILYSVAVDANGNAYLAGYGNNTYTNGALDVKNAAQATAPFAVNNAALVKLSPAGEVVFATYWGGSRAEWAQRVVVDQAGNSYIVGSSNSDDVPVVNGMAKKPSASAVLVAKFNSSGQIVYSTVFGGSVSGLSARASADVTDAAIDSAGNVYVAGYTNARDFPTKNAIQATMGGSQCPFVSVLNAQGTALLSSTYFGGDDQITALALGPSGGIYLGGAARTAQFPLKNSLIAFKTKATTTSWGFAAKLTSDGTGLLYSTLVGGSGIDVVEALAVDSSGSAWIAGSTNSTDLALTGTPIQTTVTGYGGFFAKISDSTPTGSPMPSDSSSSGTTTTTTTTTTTAALTASPSVVRFAAPAGGSAPAAQTVAVSSNVTGTAFTAAAVAGTGGSWLQVSPLTATAPAQLTLSASTAGLAAGTYAATVQITTAGGTATTVDVTIAITPAAPAVTAISPATVTAGTGQQAFTITGSGFTSATTATAVYMGYAFPVSMTPVQYVSATTIKVTLPAIVTMQPGSVVLQLANSSTGPWTPVTITVQ